MTTVEKMLDTYPADLGGVDKDVPARCIEACFDCAQACTACADACRRCEEACRTLLATLG
ncbi:hypothetical protein [Saccharothrix deserti]|uniref:hypothetical protein n=1 Tax=Saccharothrix deserti TaxID=2593674 RepID=UPI00131B668E|nr:hypothetical protein [Saccharothrix deserti]